MVGRICKVQWYCIQIRKSWTPHPSKRKSKKSKTQFPIESLPSPSFKMNKRWTKPSRQFWDRRRWKSGLSIVIWDCGRWKSGPCLLGDVLHCQDVEVDCLDNYISESLMGVLVSGVRSETNLARATSSLHSGSELERFRKPVFLRDSRRFFSVLSYIASL